MSTAAVASGKLALATKEDWKAYAESPRRIRPENLTRRQIDALSSHELARYDRTRREWHANLGPIRTPQLDRLHEDMWDIVDSNLQDGDKARGAIAVEAFPGLGKTTAALSFARTFHVREISECGAFTDEGNERIPVCRVGLNGDTGIKDFNRYMLDFFAHPGRRRGTAAEFGSRALECALKCGVRLMVIDDLHFLRWQRKNGEEVRNHLKWIANEFPVTLLMVGVGLTQKGLFNEGASPADVVFAQTARRTTKLQMEPFSIDKEEGRRAWRNLLLAIEQRIVLAEKHQGMLADDLSDYLFARSTGHIGSLMSLINRGCQRAIRKGRERLDQGLLDGVRIDEAAEAARREIEIAMANAKITSRPRQSRKRAA
ncbi:TniB family NTP-binding protein [Paractinoplanes brasiliensis]|uniref:TniB protein n=1 Tax=Paractinoplanes brasiliensis TaxID=52695 RepID=A0A4R6JSR1_9ACTN|nr:TniB family NTP-binding protein [Actinoplanes brasiliensis]TDO39519.1 TniB protein [Actinoplanes brasiliensis]GID29143.1 hypothetical protein Abr02nite_41260 [Actinoplanes brasiliensis]